MNITEISNEVYQYVFELLDSEAHIPGELADKLATETQQIVESGLSQFFKNL